MIRFSIKSILAESISIPITTTRFFPTMKPEERFKSGVHAKLYSNFYINTAPYKLRTLEKQKVRRERHLR